MDNRPRMTILDIITLIAVVMLLIALACPRAHGKELSRVKLTQREFVIRENTTAYILGHAEGGSVIRYHGQLVTNIRIQPYGASQIFDRSMAFCGDVSSYFVDKGMFIVITYDRVAHKEFCYELLGVNSVSPADASNK